MFTLIENTISFDDTSLESFYEGSTTIHLGEREGAPSYAPDLFDDGQLTIYYQSLLGADVWFSAEGTGYRYTECGVMRFFNELATVICALPMHRLDTIKFRGPDPDESWELSRAGDRYMLRESRWTEALSTDRDAFDASVWEAMGILMWAYRKQFPDITDITDYTHCLRVAGDPMFYGATGR
ncbi:hypothetical protein [Roseovarius sp.]|uniref:hypothetical protein n=1 Tax=Roseovarius sp. TaxID=1486281 RepID=UPI003BABC2A7